MGDFFERVIDVEATGDEAAALAERTVEWMVARGLLTREMSGDGMYSMGVDQGYVPGPAWDQATGDPGDRVPGPVAVIVGRNDYVAGQGEGEPESATCPRCRTETVIIDYPDAWEADEEVWAPFRRAIGAWKETGRGEVACPSCRASVPVTEWQWSGDFALGALAFEFWGWPELAGGFLSELRRRLGHRTEEHEGKF